MHARDERIAAALKVLADAGRRAGLALRRAFWLDRRLREAKGGHLNVAAVWAAVALDLSVRGSVRAPSRAARGRSTPAAACARRRAGGPSAVTVNGEPLATFVDGPRRAGRVTRWARSPRSVVRLSNVRLTPGRAPGAPRLRPDSGTLPASEGLR
ncbi:MAG TPA: hypothetical protein VFS43_22360 [Polyangiaceae bacterium]|nr:hypothetical protein [Polyangiaceae bacterium]